MPDKIDILRNILNTKGTKFLSLTYQNGKNEVSEYTVLVGANIVNSYEKDLHTLQKMGEQSGVKELARQSLIKSISESLEKGIGNNSKFTKKDYYTHLDDNVKYHKTEDDLLRIYFNGYVISKNVLIKGQYPEVKSAELTIEKNKLNKILRRGKYREFIIDTSKIESIAVNGKRIRIKGILTSPVKKAKEVK